MSERVTEVKPIRNDEEYAEETSKLNEMAKEYVQTSKDPKNAIQESLETFEVLKNKYSNAQSAQAREEQIEILQEIYRLKVKCMYLNNETYLPALRQNMMRSYVRISAYRGELDLTEINRYGIVPNEVPLNIEAPKEIYEQVIKSGNLVADMPKDEELKTGLPISTDENYPEYSPASAISQKVIGGLDKFIEGIQKQDGREADKKQPEPDKKQPEPGRAATLSPGGPAPLSPLSPGGPDSRDEEVGM